MVAQWNLWHVCFIGTALFWPPDPGGSEKVGAACDIQKIGGGGVLFLTSDLPFVQSLHNQDCAAEHVTLTNVYASTIRRHCSGRYGEM